MAYRPGHAFAPAYSALSASDIPRHLALSASATSPTVNSGFAATIFGRSASQKRTCVLASSFPQARFGVAFCLLFEQGGGLGDIVGDAARIGASAGAASSRVARIASPASSGTSSGAGAGASSAPFQSARGPSRNNTGRGKLAGRVASASFAPRHASSPSRRGGERDGDDSDPSEGGAIASIGGFLLGLDFARMRASARVGVFAREGPRGRRA